MSDELQDSEEPRDAVGVSEASTAEELVDSVAADQSPSVDAAESATVDTSAGTDSATEDVQKTR